MGKSTPSAIRETVVEVTIDLYEGYIDKEFSNKPVWHEVRGQVSM